MSVIKLKNISKIYGENTKVEFQALKNVNFEIKKGEFVAIMGPSGSGKSTLMHIIGLLDRPTRGEYLLDENEVSLKSKEKFLAGLRGKKIGFVFQTFNLMPRSTTLQNVMLPTMYHDRKNRVKRAKEMLKLVGLESKWRNKPTELSGGERQRVAIARALINNPEILLADEPTGNLDSKTGEEIMKLFRKLNKEKGVTIILITHDSDIAKQADRTIHIKDGEIR